MSDIQKPLEITLREEWYNEFEKAKPDGMRHLASTMSTVGNYGRYVLGTLALGNIANIVRKYRKSQRASRREFLSDVGMTTAYGCLGIHFHKIKQVFDGVSRRTEGETLTDQGKQDIQSSEKIGRYSHHTGVWAFVISYFTSGDGTRRDFLRAATTGILAGCFYFVNKNYDGLYTAASDYATGERTKKPTP